ncbi:uncharacterized protein [Musca autumnalis]|uniref:uncharacterized protein n=1 Tax=Musca autumnalis TaxID=221902 RepID=UPI003CE88EEA
MLRLLYLAVIFAVLSQSLLAAPSSPGDVLTDEGREHIRTVLDETKAYAGELESLIGKVLPQLPKTPAYDELHKDLEEYQQIAKEYHEVKCHCRNKALQFFEYFSQFVDKYSEEEAETVEEKEAVKLLNDAGLKEIAKLFKDKKDSGYYEYLSD